MATLILIPGIIFLSLLFLVVVAGAFIKFFKRNEAKEREIEEMIAARNVLLMRVSEMQNLANTMQTDIEGRYYRLPVQSKRAFVGKKTLMLR